MGLDLEPPVHLARYVYEGGLSARLVSGQVGSLEYTDSYVCMRVSRNGRVGLSQTLVIGSLGWQVGRQVCT